MGGFGWTNKMKTFNYFDMKKIGCFFICVIMLGAGCGKKDLQDLASVRSEPRVVSAQTIVAGEITKDNSFVTVPFHIKLNGPAGKAFQVAVDANYDTVTRLIARTKLSQPLRCAASTFRPWAVRL